MKITKLTLALTAILGVTVSTGAFAINLYIDTKTEQIYGKPGPGRVLMGSFQKTSDSAEPTAPVAAEITAIRQDLAAKTKDLSEQTKEIKALKEQAAETSKEANKPDAVKVSLKDGIKFETKDGNFTSEIHGRVQTDAQENVNQQIGIPYSTQTLPGYTKGVPTHLNESVGFRRARLSMEGTLYKDTDYKFEYDFTRGGGTTAAGITDAFMRYNFSKPFSVKIGSFKEATSLEETTSDIQTTFIERNMAVNTFIDNLNVFKVGIGANYSADRWQAAAGLQTQGPGVWGPANVAGSSIINNTAAGNGGVNNNGGQGDTSWELNGRVSVTPWMASKNQLLHVGGWGSYVNLNNNYNGANSFTNGGVVFANGIGNNMDRSAILSTGNLTSSTNKTQANHLDRFGFETALVNGPFSAQAEYLQTGVHGTGYGEDTSLNGYYGYMTYFLTGESRNYVTRTASFDRVKPLHNFDLRSGGGIGAWEVAAGYDYVNLNSNAIHGGKASTVKFGVNWYPNPRVRLMTNYIHALDIATNNNVALGNAPANPYNNAKLDMIEERVQIDW